jgi:hypothetical protein
VFLWTGAFNDATIHFERLIALFQQTGDVCVVRYPDKRFSAQAAMYAAYDYALFHRDEYDEILLEGASLGGEIELRFVECAHIGAVVDGYNPALKMVACDAPLGGKHLPAPAWLLRLVRHVHFGPLFNLLSPLVTPLAFKKLQPHQTDGVDNEHWSRHMVAMRSCKLSLIAEQIAAMTIQPPFTDVGNVPTVYLQCDLDDVIRGDAAANDWRELIEASSFKLVRVKAGHVQFVENHNPWRDAHVRALGALGYSVC